MEALLCRARAVTLPALPVCRGLVAPPSTSTHVKYLSFLSVHKNWITSPLTHSPSHRSCSSTQAHSCYLTSATRHYSHSLWSPYLNVWWVGATAGPLLRPQGETCSSMHLRGYAKSKDKKGGKSKHMKVHVSDEEMEEVVNVQEMKDKFAQVVEDLREDYIKNLSLRSAAGSVETLPVMLEGDEYPLNELAQVSRKSAHTVIISAAAFPQALPGILAAIRGSGMNLNPQQDGTSIILPIPKVTKEHREGLAKNAKTLYNKCKEQLRDTQNYYIRKVRRKDGQVSEDLLHNVQLKIRELADIHTHEAENLMTAKQKELLKMS